MNKGIFFPKVIDINPTAKCNLHCSFCWGPDHNIRDSLSTSQWKSVINFFAKNGTTSIIFTGGEPLIRKDLVDLVKFAKEREMKITLSTNTLLLLTRGRVILPYIDEIGVPLDGSTQEMNSKMRLGNLDHYSSSINALHFIRNNYPSIHITVRTVVSKVNKNDISNIGKLLLSHYGYFDRWKLYHFTPVSIGAKHKKEHYLSNREFNNIGRQVLFQSPKLKIDLYPSNKRFGRYIFIGPEGNIFGVDYKGYYKIVANFLRSSETGIVQGIKDVLRYERNIRHAQ